jgi:hypothetical protein
VSIDWRMHEWKEISTADWIWSARDGILFDLWRLG